MNERIGAITAPFKDWRRLVELMQAGGSVTYSGPLKVRTGMTSASFSVIITMMHNRLSTVPEWISFPRARRRDSRNIRGL